MKRILLTALRRLNSDEPTLLAAVDFCRSTFRIRREERLHNQYYFTDFSSLDMRTNPSISSHSHDLLQQFLHLPDIATPSQMTIHLFPFLSFSLPLFSHHGSSKAERRIYHATPTQGMECVSPTPHPIIHNLKYPLSFFLSIYPLHPSSPLTTIILNEKCIPIIIPSSTSF